MLNLIQAVVKRPNARRWLSAAAGLAFAAAAAVQPAKAEDTIKIGILHSLSGTMAISETTLKDVMLMLIDEQNKKGGLLGKKLEAVVVDPASNWPLFAEKARELISKDKVAVVFGCWTSVSRKSVLPVFKELNSILFYPVQYEGEESERNVFYTGAAPNQQAIPAVDYLMSKDGGKVKRWVLEGTDYVYPRTTNKILEAYLKVQGREGRGHHDQLHAVRLLRLADRSVARSRSSARPARRPRSSPPSTATPTCRSTRNSATRASRPTTSRWWRSRSAKKNSPASTPSRWSAISPPGTTSRSIKTPANEEFIKEWHAFTKNPKRTTNDPMEAHYIGFNMWVKAVEKAKSTDPDKVIAALPGIKRAEPHRRHLRRCCRTTTSPSRSISAKSAPTASSTWCGRPRVWSPAKLGRTICRARRTSLPTG